MAATQWKPYHRALPITWLLGNGDKITEPPMEESGSGRRIRFKSGNGTSRPKGEMAGMLAEWAESLAKRRRTVVLLELRDNSSSVFANLGWNTVEQKTAQMHLIHEPKEVKAKTKCWWTFENKDAPFTVWVTLTLTPRPDGISQVQQGRLYMPVREWAAGATTTKVAVMTSGRFNTAVNYVGRRRFGLEDEWKAWIEDNPATWTVDVLGESKWASPRQAMKEFLRSVRLMEDRDTIQVPDFRTPDKPGYMDLELTGTNVNGQFISDMTEYLDGTPAMQQALHHYEALLETLRSVGVDVRKGADADNDFASAMVAGESSHVMLPVHNPIGDGPLEVDKGHGLAIHLPSGSMVVECKHTAPVTPATNPELITQKWEEAKLIARLTGEEDELLAYAREYARHEREKRIKGAVQDRS